MHILRKYIRECLIFERHISEEDEDALLLEPDMTDEEPQDEVNAISSGGASMQSSGAITGVSTPLGTGPAYPNKRKKKSKKKLKTGSTDWYKLGNK